MGGQNTIYQTLGFNVGRDSVCIDGDEIFYDVQKDRIVINSRLIPFSMYGEKIINYFFDKFHNVSCLKFASAVGRENEVLSSATLREKAFDSNFLLILPNDLQTYTQSLGTKTRQHLNRYLRNIEKELKISRGGYI